MKKLVFCLALFAIMTIPLPSNYYDYNDDGWDASNGMTTYPGDVESYRTIPGGYAIHCVGMYNICYEINGPNLTIYSNVGPGDCDPNIGIFRR